MVIKLDVRINLAGSTTPMSILAKVFGDTHADVLANFLIYSYCNSASATSVREYVFYVFFRFQKT